MRGVGFSEFLLRFCCCKHVVLSQRLPAATAHWGGGIELNFITPCQLPLGRKQWSGKIKLCKIAGRREKVGVMRMSWQWREQSDVFKHMCYLLRKPSTRPVAFVAPQQSLVLSFGVGAIWMISWRVSQRLCEHPCRLSQGLGGAGWAHTEGGGEWEWTGNYHWQLSPGEHRTHGSPRSCWLDGWHIGV